MIKLKTLLNEELLGEYLGYEIFKNPKSIKRMDADLRGISFPNGDLFVIDDGRNVVHSQLSDWLKRNKYSIPIDMSLLPELAKGIKKGYIEWQRKGTSNNFYLSESVVVLYSKFDEKTVVSYIKKYIPKIKAKNPNYKFIPESVF